MCVWLEPAWWGRPWLHCYVSDVLLLTLAACLCAGFVHAAPSDAWLAVSLSLCWCLTQCPLPVSLPACRRQPPDSQHAPGRD